MAEKQKTFTFLTKSKEKYKMFKRIDELIKDAEVWANTERGKRYISEHLVDDPVRADETVFGVVPEDLRLLMVYSYNMMTEEYHNVINRAIQNTVKNMSFKDVAALAVKGADELIESMGLSKTDKEKLARLGAEMKCLKEIFWVEVRDRFGKHDCNIGIRNEWYLVDMPSEKENGEDELKHLLEMNDKTKPPKKTND